MHSAEVAVGQSPADFKKVNIALIGNPNSGKSSLFNLLTGLHQKVGNFPGVTVEWKKGDFRLDNQQEVTLIDFPGTYSCYPNSQDERIVIQNLLDPDSDTHPDAIIYVADITKLENHLLLLTQIVDLGFPVLLVLNMADIAEAGGITIKKELLEEQLRCRTVMVSSRTGSGVEALRIQLQELINQLQGPIQVQPKLYELSTKEKQLSKSVQEIASGKTPYHGLLMAHHHSWLPFLGEARREKIAKVVQQTEFESLRAQVTETLQRFNFFTPLVKQAIRTQTTRKSQVFTEKLDNILTHRIAGPLLFLVLMLLVFQSIYSWASYPMDGIEAIFGWFGEGLQQIMPDTWYSDLLTNGIIAGLAGILVFIPQIAILFFLIAILEEVGYMARAAYIFDRIMQFFGLNGRSIVALISGGACAIPAIMSTRTISNWKERLITILVTPLISCSARIPVYTVLIGFVVPASTVGIFNLQGLAFMGLYLLGIVAALLTALVFKLILRSGERSYLMLELPEYRWPVMRNVGYTVWEKVKTFVWEAGKIIFVISIVLWFLSSYGPEASMAAAIQETNNTAAQQGLDETQTADLLAAKKLEASYAGIFGKFVEPAIQPLGFDWKIGIALITSFAAREVFVGTMATIYSIGSEADEYSVRKQMAAEIRPDTGKPVYDLATSLSLLIFYAFAMQCMSTLAVVKRETNSYKWPLIQFLYLSALAYFGSLLVYQLLS